MADFPKLFIPGPTHVSDEILKAFSTPQIGHRTPEISELISQLILDIQKVLYTKNHIYLVSHPATGLWEMAIRNSVKKRVLHCVNGAFSKKWAQVSKEVGVDYDILEYEWGKAIDASDIKQKLESAKWFIDAVRQRFITIRKVVESIIKHQQTYFNFEDRKLTPMILEDIATDISMDISTISRVTNGKYVQMTW